MFAVRHPYWVRRELASLDPRQDYRRIAQLLFEVRFGSPLFFRPLFSVAFARQVAVPAIAETLYRDGRGIIMHDTARRNDDTIVFFGLLFRHLGTPQADRVIRRMVKLHERFDIPNELNLYTLATLACLPQRFGRQFGVPELLGPGELEALHRFWADVGAQMGIRGIPETSEALLEWMLDYEAAEYAPTMAGREVTRALSDELAARLFPAPLQARGRYLFFGLFDDHLREVHGIPAPTLADQAIVQLTMRSLLKAARVLPDPPDRNFVEQYGQRYGTEVSPEQVGPTDAQMEEL